MLGHITLLVFITYYFVGKLGLGKDIQRSNKVIDQNGRNAFEEIWHINKNGNQSKQYFEGDIKLEEGDPFRKYIFAENGNHGFKRNAVRERYYLWREKSVPYVIDGKLKESGTFVIEEAMKLIQSKSCIKFTKHQTEDNWIKIVKKPGCSSAVGRAFWRKGSQEVNLGEGCLSVGTITHELLHVLGFWHEQSRPDRDEYVEIMWENIIPGEEGKFKRYDLKTIDLQETLYDYESIMHYGRTAFSKSPGLSTIVAIKNKGQPLGQRDHLSNGDIVGLNLLYDCKKDRGRVGHAFGNKEDKTTGTSKDFFSAWSHFGPCNMRCYKEKQRFCSHKDVQMCPGADYYGIEGKQVKCPDVECYAPIDGHWGRWSSWSDCSVTCDDGTRVRNRNCNDPSPKNKGKQCVGKQSEEVKCNLHSCASGQYGCQFELDKCIWHSDSANYNWKRKKGPTPTGKTGPDQDHTKGEEGYYIYTEASFPAKRGNVANLTSNQFNTIKEGRCMSFWYHMYGTGTGTLSVLTIQREETGYSEKLLWKKSGNQGNKWVFAEVELKSKGNYSVRFTAIRGRSYLSDIALDDIFFKEGPCKKVNSIGIMYLASSKSAETL